MERNHGASPTMHVLETPSLLHCARAVIVCLSSTPLCDHGDLGTPLSVVCNRGVFYLIGPTGLDLPSAIDLPMAVKVLAGLTQVDFVMTGSPCFGSSVRVIRLYFLISQH